MAVRIARFVHPGGAAFGVVEGITDPVNSATGVNGLTVAEIEGHPFGEIRFTGQRWALSDVTLLSPILPSKVVAVGHNYPAHIEEFNTVKPKEPLLFLKPSTTIIGPDDAIRLPIGAGRIDYEAELAVIIGVRGARDVSREQALTRVFGYTCANDVTARDQQNSDDQWTRAKGYDSFCPLGPWIETDIDSADLAISTRVDGELRQQARTSEMLFDVATIISYVSHIMTLLPGDVILTGTPTGVGPLSAGQRVTVSIEGVGALTNPVVTREPAASVGP